MFARPCSRCRVAWNTLTSARAGEVVGAAIDAGPHSAAPVAAEVRIDVAEAFGRLDELEAMSLRADGGPGDGRVVRVLPARHIGTDDARGGGRGRDRDQGAD